MKNAVAIVSLITIFTLFFTFGMGCTDPDVEERISFLGCSAGVVKDNRTDNRDYVFKVVSVVDNDKILSVEELRFTLFSADRRDMSDGHHRVSDIYENPINDKNFFSFRDGTVMESSQ
jgi:hypothetical protein